MSEKKIKGVMSSRVAVKVNPVPTRMENKFISKATFLENLRKDKEANAAAEAARTEVLKKKGLSVNEGNSQDSLEAAGKKVANIKSAIKDSKSDLEKAPASKRIKDKLAKLNAQLDDAENKLDELEDN